ncbi:MAG: hypothetical protein ABGX16_08020 [Pirellulales bacterium]
MRHDLNHPYMRFLYLPFLAMLASLMIAAPSSAVVVWSEDFEGLALIDSQIGSDGDNETDWNTVAASGLVDWSMNPRSTPIAPVANYANEYYGWTVVDHSFWLDEQGNQVGRADFLPGLQPNNTILVVEPDGHDDFIDIDPDNFSAVVKTPLIDISGFAANTLEVSFFSTWVPEDLQEAAFRVTYDTTGTTELFRWDSQAGANFKSAATNENVQIAINNPVGASTVQLEWDMVEAGNDWWWGIDNISVDAPALLTLRVDPASGEMELRGNLDLAILTGYEITSPSGSLDAVGWQAGNLAAQNIDPIGLGPGESWESLFFTSSQLAETFLLGSSAFDSTRIESLGSGYDPAGTPDLVFEFSQPDGSITQGIVEYATIYQDADFNENGTVDGAD